MSLPPPPPMDILEELGLSEPVPMTSQQNETPVTSQMSEIAISSQQNMTPITNQLDETALGNDFHHENHEYHDIHDQNNGFTPVTKEESSSLQPVQPGEGGEGLPYAPVDWPSPGDAWCWRVGRRINNSGFYVDRFLYPPRRLQKANRREHFASKAAVTSYIHSNFPGADVDALFASFSWKIPAPLQPETEAAAALATEVPQQSEVPEIEKEETGKASRTSQRKRKPIETYSSLQPTATPKPKRQTRQQPKQSTSSTPKNARRRSSTRLAAHESSTEDFEGDQVTIPNIYVSPDSSFIATCHSPIEVIPEEFDNYLNSLDEIITQPLSGVSSSSLAITKSPILEQEEMANARSKLSFLLDVDFQTLLCNKNLPELANLASKLQKDPTLSAEQLVKLKLIEELPSFSQVFVENKEIVEQANKFFATLEINKGNATSLKKEYGELKDKVDQLQAEVDSSNMTIKEIDNQIAQLKSRRAELVGLIKERNKTKADYAFSQKMLANSIPKVVKEIQLANSKMPEWQLKKENAVKREAQILAKFEPLKGFTL